MSIGWGRSQLVWVESILERVLEDNSAWIIISIAGMDDSCSLGHYTLQTFFVYLLFIRITKFTL